MKRIPFWSSVLALALAGALVAGGCAKKQVRQEGAVSQAQAKVEERPAPAPAPKPAVRETPLSQEQRDKAEAPPDRTAAVERAPDALKPGTGLSQATSQGLERIFFEYDQYVLTPEARQVLTKNSEYLARNPGVRLRIEGHCDERGTTEYNLALGERRAKSAYQYLMDLGVDPNRMNSVSYGEESPLDPTHNPTAWAKNRRAEFVEIQ